MPSNIDPNALVLQFVFYLVKTCYLSTASLLSASIGTRGQRTLLSLPQAIYFPVSTVKINL